MKRRLPIVALDEFAARHELRRLYLFGSIFTDRFHNGSDVDVMIDPGARMPSYFDTCRMAEELEALFGRPVDLVIKSTIERDRNPRRRSAILDGARLLVDRSASSRGRSWRSRCPKPVPDRSRSRSPSRSRTRA